MKTPLLASVLILTLAAFGPTGCDQPVSNSTPDHQDPLSDEELMTRVQEQTFQYFWEGGEPNSGLARERYHVDGDYPQDDQHVVTMGGSGFGLMNIIVGIERGFITREEGVSRFERAVTFLDNADQFRGAWPHWLNGETGEVQAFSGMDDGADLVETAFLVQGLLTVRQYLRGGTDREEAIANQIDEMWQEIEWDWFTQDENVLYWHWSPNHGFGMDHPILGYDETMVTYILAASSPTHRIDPDVYHEGWARGGEIRLEGHEQYGYSLPLRHNGAEQYGGPLFWAHYSFLGLDPRDLSDQYGDYWQNNVNHARINRQWSVQNPNACRGYGPKSWGLTASYSPTEDGGVGYAAHAPGRDRDHCTITPTAALSSFPYTPEYSMDALRYFYEELGDSLWGPYGFYDAFSEERRWFPERYLAIDQGPIVAMIENHRTGMLWDLFMSSPEIQDGLERLGFESPHLQ